MYLWEAKLPKEEVKRVKLNVSKMTVVEMKETYGCLENFNSMLAGPVANNPSSKAVRMVVNFGSPERTILFPSTSEKSRQSLFKYDQAVLISPVMF